MLEAIHEEERLQKQNYLSKVILDGGLNPEKFLDFLNKARSKFMHNL